MRKTKWLLCPVCDRKTHSRIPRSKLRGIRPSRQSPNIRASTAAWLVARGNKIREDTELKNLPLYCPKCKQETVVDVEQFIVSVCKDKAK